MAKEARRIHGKDFLEAFHRGILLRAQVARVAGMAKDVDAALVCPHGNQARDISLREDDRVLDELGLPRSRKHLQTHAAFGHDSKIYLDTPNDRRFFWSELRDRRRIGGAIDSQTELCEPGLRAPTFAVEGG